jgi:hypothetical protein
MPAQGGRLATGGVAGTAGKSSASGGVAAGGKSAASGGIAGTGGESHATGGEAPNGGSSVGGDPSTGGDPSLSEIPQDGLLLWLAADRGVVQSSGIVSKWQDQSAQHRDASQVVSGARPKRIEDAQNGLPMLEFDGVDDALALPEGLADFSTGVSFFSVVHLLEDGVCQSVLQLSNGPEIDDIDFGRFQGSVHYEVAAEYLTGQMDAFGLNQTVLMNYAQDVDGGVELRLDGQFIIAGSAMLPAVIPRVANFVGRSLYAECRFLSARVGEIVLYARPLASDERTQVEAYLRSKWGCCKI